LISTLKNLFVVAPLGRRGVSDAAPVQRYVSVRTGPDNERPGIPSDYIDTTYCGHVLGVQSATDCELNMVEKGVLRELDRLLTSARALSVLVPALPAAVSRLLGSLRKGDASVTQLLAELGRDPVLARAVVGLSNSPRYRAGTQTAGLQDAVFGLGPVGIRQLAVAAAVRPLIDIDAGYFTRLSGTTLWEHAEKSAFACDYLASKTACDRLDAYLAAVVQNIGFALVLRTLDRKFNGDHVPRSAMFRERTVSQSRKLSVAVARQWALPDAVVRALEAQIDAVGRVGHDDLASILYVGDKLAKMHILAGVGRFGGRVDHVIDTSFGRLSDYCGSCYARLSARTRSTASG
jgi:HD-like signal output (HDOD) protein